MKQVTCVLCLVSGVGVDSAMLATLCGPLHTC